MKDNVKLDVAIEIVSSKLTEAIKNKDREKSARLLKLKKQAYLGNQEVIDMLTKNK